MCVCVCVTKAVWILRATVRLLSTFFQPYGLISDWLTKGQKGKRVSSGKIEETPAIYCSLSSVLLSLYSISTPAVLATSTSIHPSSMPVGPVCY